MYEMEQQEPEELLLSYLQELEWREQWQHNIIVFLK